MYAHKVVEGLLEQGLQVTVVCQENNSQFEHQNLKFKLMPAEKKGSKFQRLTRLCGLTNQAIKELRTSTDVQLVHSQHCPNDDSDVVTFHNHSTQRLNEVGLWWEGALNDTKRRFVNAYKMRDEHDEALLRRANCLIFPAEVMKADFYSAFPFLAGPPPKPYVVAPPGAAMQEEAPTLSALNSAESSGFPANEPFSFLFVGRGFRKKGLDVLFSACKLLKTKTSRPFTLSIAGLAQKTADTFRLNLLGLNGIVNYLGFQKDMNSVYARSAVIILPSRVEPFGMAPVQAMQHGLVPIVSRVCGVAEVLHNDLDALILQNHLDANELADLMLKIMSDPALLKRLSAQALQTARNLSWAHTVEQTIKAYEIALSLKK